MAQLSMLFLFGVLDIAVAEGVVQTRTDTLQVRSLAQRQLASAKLGEVTKITFRADTAWAVIVEGRMASLLRFERTKGRWSFVRAESEGVGSTLPLSVAKNDHVLWRNR